MTGRIFYVRGPSGAGKDSLLDYVRERLGRQARVLFAHRYITRPPGGNENHISLSEAEFAARLRAGLFAFSWASHGFHYGIGIEIDLWTNAGFDVVVNGSREAYATLPQGREVLGVLITASTSTLRKRLLARGRESVEMIEARLARSHALEVATHAFAIANDGPLDEGGDALLDVLTSAPRA